MIPEVRVGLRRQFRISQDASAVVIGCKKSKEWLVCDNILKGINKQTVRTRPISPAYDNLYLRIC